MRRVAIESRAIRAEVLPDLGARLDRLTVFGQDLLRTPNEPLAHREAPFHWGGYVMAPWCNRIEPGPTRVGGRTVDVASNAADGSALHGQVLAAAWDELTDGRFVIEGGLDGWPWKYRSSIRFGTLDRSPRRATLIIEQDLSNLDHQPMPGGIGFHPWFRVPLDVRIDAARVLPSNLGSDGRLEAVAGDFDLRVMRAMPAGLDATWVDPGDPAVELVWPDLGLIATLHVESSVGRCIVAASPSDIDAVAIEPETHAPQGLQRLLDGASHGLQWLAPGATMHLTTRIHFRRLPGGRTTRPTAARIASPREPT